MEVKTGAIECIEELPKLEEIIEMELLGMANGAVTAGGTAMIGVGLDGGGMKMDDTATDGNVSDVTSIGAIGVMSAGVGNLTRGAVVVLVAVGGTSLLHSGIM